MIKIESVEGICTVIREGEECVLFPGMQISPEEVETITAGGDLVYCIDETQVVVVPKGEKATITTVAVEAVEETEASKEEANTEAAPQAEVVTKAVETPAPVTAKK